MIPRGVVGLTKSFTWGVELIWNHHRHLETLMLFLNVMMTRFQGCRDLMTILFVPHKNNSKEEMGVVVPLPGL